MSAAVRLLALGLVLGPGCGDDLAPEDDGPDAGVDVDIAAVPPGCVAGRADVDRPDDHRFDQLRVLYALPADAPDRGLDTSGRICDSVRGFATWFHEQSGAYLRFDTAGGLVDVGFVRLRRTDAELHGDDPANLDVATGHAFVRNRIEDDLAAAGQLRGNKLYAVYYDGTSSYSCGGGAFPPLIVDRVGAVYLRAAPFGDGRACGEGPWGAADLRPAYVDYAILHELVHTLGFVPDSAPHAHSMGHVFDDASPTPARDLMYTPRPGHADPYWATDDPRGLILDLGHDDYAGVAQGLELLTSSLVAPLADDAHRPPGW